MSFLEKAGNPTTVYLYSPRPHSAVDVNAVRDMMGMTSAYPDIHGEFRVYNPDVGVDVAADAIIACDWQTAYAAARYAGQAKRLYFAQDYEPFFYAAGSDYAAAENSYRLGLHGITAGPWLARTLQEQFGMTSDHYDYGVETDRYRYENRLRRNEVLFYARPPTPRRATEFGLLALQELHRMRPDITIHLVGWDMSGHRLPFPFVNHAALDIADLGAVYNRCAAGMVLSLTNTSLLPLEIMAAGVVPVVNDAPQTREVLRNPNIDFTPMAPRALAERLIAAVDRPDQTEHAERIAASVADTHWGDPGAEFVATFDRVMETSL
ncbi:rhamnosyltransferase WsaF family glycosyltransferase [Glaciibacter flavus]|uniref:rhamnosyltransferase WsaF family glycosyltransferase n=1 Tax=Orlajensenia flava TaxID=2565934 RepID=UPI003AFF7892